MSGDELRDELRERLTDIVEEWQESRAAGGPTTTSITPGMVLVSERESGPWISCASCSGVMVAHATGANVPASLDAAHRVRSSAGLPHSGGMTTDDVDRGLRGAYGVDLGGTNRDSIPGRLSDGWAVMAMLTYGELPTHFRRWCPDFVGNHAVALAGWSNGRAGLFDPLATAGYGGEWIDWDDLRPAVWTSGHLNGKLASAGGEDDVRFGSSAGYAIDSGQRMAIANGAEWYYLDGARGGAFTAATEVVCLGLVDGDPGFHRYLVKIGTGSPYADKQTRDTVVMVNSSNPPIPAPEPEPGPEPGPPAGGDYDEGYAKGRVDEWDAWDAALGIPDRPE